MNTVAAFQSNTYLAVQLVFHEKVVSLTISFLVFTLCLHTQPSFIKDSLDN